MTDSDLFEQIETQNPEAVKELANGKPNTMEPTNTHPYTGLIVPETPTPKGFIKLHVNADGRTLIIAIKEIRFYYQHQTRETATIDTGGGPGIDGSICVQETLDQISAQITKQML